MTAIPAMSGLAVLAPVRRRQRQRSSLEAAALGVIAGSVAVIVLEIVRRMMGWWIAPWPALLLLLCAPVAAWLGGAVLQYTWYAAARAVDQRYSLKDRTTTALQLLAQPQATTIEQLQIKDAASHLQRVDPRHVVPIYAPRYWQQAICLVVLAGAFAFWPYQPGAQAFVPTGPIRPIVAVAETIDADLDELEEAADEEQDEQLHELVTKLRDLTEAMKQPDVDVREAMAQLSQMQNAIAKQQAQFNIALVDQHLHALGKAMALASPLQKVGKDLKQGEYDKAAKALSQMPAPKLKKRDAQTVAQQMQKVAAAMKKAGLGRFGEAASQMAQGLGSGDGKGFSKAGKGLGKALRGHGRRRGINAMLRRQLARLSDLKMSTLRSLCAACQGRGCSKCNGSGLNDNASASDSPSNSWGTGTAGNINGPATRIDSQRNWSAVTGKTGDGPSHRETEDAPASRQQAQRTYNEVYREYRKLSEAVLESEPIPAGHRQTIRRYFELIRPENPSDTDGN